MPKKLYTCFSILFIIFSTNVFYTNFNILSRQINLSESALDLFFSNYRANYLPYVSTDIAWSTNILIEPQVSVPIITAYRKDHLDTLVIFLKSVHKEDDLRDAIRNTWGTYFQKRLVFTLAGEITAELKEESDKHGDILLLQYQDHYQKLVIKTIQTYKLMAKLKDLYPHIRWFFSGDSDVFIIPGNLRKFTKEHQNDSNSIYGKVFGNHPTKWVYNWYDVSYQLPRPIYPDFVSGGLTLMTSDVPQKLISAMPFIKPLNIEDIYTGMLSDKSNVHIMRETTKHFCVIASVLKLVQVGIKQILCNYSEIVATTEFKTSLQVRRFWKNLPDIIKK